MGQTKKEALKYIAVGVIGLGVEWISFFIFRDLLDVRFVFAHILSSLLAITNNFILNSYFTFKATDKIWQRGLYFFGIAGIGLVISTSLLPFFVQLFNFCFPYANIEASEKVVQTLAKLGATGVVTILQFFFNKYITFKKKTNDIQG